jgi:signal transduction histidine kinase
MARILWLLAGLLALPVPVASAQPSFDYEGRPLFAQRFRAQDYGAAEQNWWTDQDERGVVFVANRTGVLEYDGRSWRVHAIPNQFTRSLAVGEGGRVYVGGVGEVGYLDADSTGSLVYTSLLAEVPEDQRGFADLWTTYVAADGVYFQGFRHVLRWDGRAMQVWTTQGQYHKGFVAHGRYYVREEGVGLLAVAGEDLVLAPGGGRFASVRVDALLPRGTSDLVVVTRDQGLLVGRDGTFAPFPTGADRYLHGQRVYQGAQVADSLYALSTFTGTVVILNQQGDLVRILGAEVGLSSDEMVLHVFPDRQGGLWLALDKGLLRVDVPTAVTVFDQRDGLAGGVYSMTVIDGTLYAATSQGVFTLSQAGQPSVGLGRRARFERVGDLAEQVWFVQEAGGQLLAAGLNGVYELRGTQARQVLGEGAFAFLESRSRPGLAYVGLKNGVGILRLGVQGWEPSGQVRGMNIGEVRHIVEDEDGRFWLGTLSEGLLRVRIDADQVVEVEAFGAGHGLDGSTVMPLARSEGVMFVSSAGIYRPQWNGGVIRFEQDEPLSRAVLGERLSAYHLNLSLDGRQWVIRDGRLFVLETGPDGVPSDVTPPALRFPGMVGQYVFVEHDGVAWVTGTDGLVRYDPRVGKDYAGPYQALVRAVYGRGGRLLFGGARGGAYVTPALAFGQGDLRFEFAAPTFNRSEETLYRYRLEGFDEEWSAWGDLEYKEYTNLSERRYQFHVQALNAQGIESEVGTYTFRVLPPWYRTWWAYALYVLGAAFVLWAYGRWRIRKHHALLLRERAARQQMDVANAQLRTANERLHQADKLKDDLLANTSHELRTPLTSILGFAAVLQEELNGELQEFASHIHRSGQRLLGTVNALLDMARLQADVMEIEAEEFDLVQEAHAIVQGLEPQAAQKGLFLKVLPEGLSVVTCLDRGSLERILTNLVGNAIKFTEHGGVTVLIDADQDSVYLTVRDTGIGIREEFLPHLFNPFSQASTGYARTYEGNGLGLAITQRIVHLLDGDIRVESPANGGTAFQVRLPRRELRSVQPPLPEATRLAGRRVLLVEDPRRPHRHLQRLLHQHTHLEVAEGLHEALAQARTQAFDLVLVDGHLGNGEAGAALAALRGADGVAQAPAVAVTAFPMPGDHERFLALGFADHIGKPFTRSRLVTSLEALIEAEPVA